MEESSPRTENCLDKFYNIITWVEGTFEGKHIATIDYKTTMIPNTEVGNVYYFHHTEAFAMDKYI